MLITYMFVGVGGYVFEYTPWNILPVVSISMVNTYQREIIVESACAFYFNFGVLPNL